MLIKKGQLLNVNHSRKGKFQAVAESDFDTETTEFYPLFLANEQYVRGLVNDWESGEHIPCRSGLCSIEKVI
jgi:hypothetical protein